MEREFTAKINFSTFHRNEIKHGVDGKQTRSETKDKGMCSTPKRKVLNSQTITIL